MGQNFFVTGQRSFFRIFRSFCRESCKKSVENFFINFIILSEEVLQFVCEEVGVIKSLHQRNVWMINIMLMWAVFVWVRKWKIIRLCARSSAVYPVKGQETISVLSYGTGKDISVGDVKDTSTLLRKFMMFPCPMLTEEASVRAFIWDILKPWQFVCLLRAGTTDFIALKTICTLCSDL